MSVHFKCSNMFECATRFAEHVIDKFVSQGQLSDEDKNNLVRSFINTVVRLYRFKCNDITRRNQLYLNEVKKALLYLGYTVMEVNASLKYVGLVDTSATLLKAILEVGLAWDFINDTPFIKASSVKGALRTVVLQRCVMLPDKERMACLKAAMQLLGYVEKTAFDELRELSNLIEGGLDKLKFEVKQQESLILFVDAYPVKCPVNGLIKGWILTPHYKDVEDEYGVRPTPIPHIVLNEGVVFRFLVGFSPEAVHPLRVIGEHVLGVRVRNLTEAIANVFAPFFALALRIGVGARTSKGYSCFDVLSMTIHVPSRGGVEK